MGLLICMVPQPQLVQEVPYLVRSKLCEHGNNLLAALAFVSLCISAYLRRKMNNGIRVGVTYLSPLLFCFEKNHEQGYPSGTFHDSVNIDFPICFWLQFSLAFRDTNSNVPELRGLAGSSGKIQIHHSTIVQPKRKLVLCWCIAGGNRRQLQQ